eukprot:IDg12640t1
MEASSKELRLGDLSYFMTARVFSKLHFASLASIHLPCKRLYRLANEESVHRRGHAFRLPSLLGVRIAWRMMERGISHDRSRRLYLISSRDMHSHIALVGRMPVAHVSHSLNSTYRLHWAQLLLRAVRYHASEREGAERPSRLQVLVQYYVVVASVTSRVWSAGSGMGAGWPGCERQGRFHLTMEGRVTMIGSCFRSYGLRLLTRLCGGVVKGRHSIFNNVCILIEHAVIFYHFI